MAVAVIDAMGPCIGWHGEQSMGWASDADGGASAPLFLCALTLGKPQKKGGEAMSKKQKKRPTEWKDVAVNALVDLVIGLILLIIDKMIG